MKKLAFLGGTVGVSLAALLGLHLSQAADHLDSSNLATNPMGDLNDVYAWMTNDGAKMNLALTVSPLDDGTRTFGPSILYAFHVVSRSAFTMPTGESKVICKFASNTSAECWVTDTSNKVVDYVKGNPSTAMTSESGKLKVFAGQRSDPFFFNLGGYKSAVGQVITKCGGSACPGALTPFLNAAGCPPVNAVDAGGLRFLITHPPSVDVAPCMAGSSDCFGTFNVMAVVVQVDKTLLLAGTDKLVSVWASTNQ